VKPKPGDRVKTMDDTANYTVVRRLAGDVVLVRTDDGLEIPFGSENLILAVVKPENLNIAKSDKPSRGKTILKKNRSVAHNRGMKKEVDLHVKGSYSGTNKLTTIELQIIRFRSELDAAIKTGCKEITFIHGLGLGILKKEIRQVVSENYPGCTCQDAPFSRYGVDGATLIVIGKRT